jgi:hypothetical protein
MELVLIVALVALLVRSLGKSTRERSTEGRATGWSRNIAWRVIVPLARRDAWMVLRHPAFVAGVLMTPLMLIAATRSAPTWRIASTGIALGLVPLGWMTIIAVNLVALRSRRSGTNELFSALPAPQPVRTTALLLAAVAPATIATAFAGGCVLYLHRSLAMRGDPLWAEIGAGVLVVVGSVAVGVAVARWLPHAGFGLVAAIVTILLQARFLDVRTWPWDRPEGDPMRFLAFLAPPTSVADDFLEMRRAGWHLLYLGGLIVVMVGVALAREGARRTVATVLAAGVALTAIAGWMQTRPASQARLDAMVSYLLEPERHQTCTESPNTTVCAYPGFEDQVDDWVAQADATLALLPSSVVQDRGRVAVSQRAPVVQSNANCSPSRFENSLPAEVAEQLTDGVVWPADGKVHPPFEPESFPCSDRGSKGFFLAAQVGAWAVGLPPASHDRFSRCTANGQARSVIALWAAAASSDDGGDTLEDVIDEGSSIGTRLDFVGWDEPPVWGVEYSVTDARLALAMLELPPADVAEVVAARWEEWIAASTPSSELADALGLSADPTPRLANGPPCA